MSAIIVPPIRAPLTDPRGGTAGRRTAASAEAQTTKEWYLFFEKLARAMGRLDSSVNQGTHEERLATAPGNVPDGALWVETDRGNVVYQVQKDENGEPVWVYLAGTLTGTLTPDERPDDLGEFDAGFTFAASDTGALYVWDGTAWVDITPYPAVSYGTHAERLAVSPAGIADGAMWVETDRGNVVYQVQAGIWWYIAGIMAGITSPDQRPTDLGAADIDFRFRDTAGGVVWTWTGTAWTTPSTGPAVPIDLVLLNGWANFGAPFRGASCVLDSNGFVHLRGVIGYGTSITAGTVLCYLPPGYYPLVSEIFGANYAGGDCRIDVSYTGSVTLGGTLATNAYLSLSGISFATLA